MHNREPEALPAVNSSMAYWCAKTEPHDFAWETLLAEKTVQWDGVRNYQARNNLQAMAVGDYVLFYQSLKGLVIRGIMQVTKPAYPDPTADSDKWVAVEMGLVKAFATDVSLQTIKETPALSEIALVKQSRLSVMPLTEEEFSTLLKLGNTTL